MKEVKFRFRLKLIEDEFGSLKKGDIHTQIISLMDEKSGLARYPIDPRWEILSCDMSTGKVDVDGDDIFGEDIIHVEYEASRSLNIIEPYQYEETHVVKWENQGFNIPDIDQHFRQAMANYTLNKHKKTPKWKIIGNTYDTPEKIPE